MNILDTPIEFLKGVGPARSELMRTEMGVRNLETCCTTFPLDTSTEVSFYPISEVDPEAAMVQVKGKFIRIDSIGSKRAVRMVGAFQDDQGNILEVAWFRSLTWIKQSIKTDVEYVLFGKPGMFKGKLQMTHPEIEPLANFNKPLKGGLEGVYSTTEKLKARKLDSRAIRKLMEVLIPQVINHVSETLPAYVRKRQGFTSQSKSLKRNSLSTQYRYAITSSTNPEI